MSYQPIVLAALIIGLVSSAWAQDLSCSDQNGDCLERSFEQSCTGEPSSAARCDEWLRALEQSSAGGEVQAKLLAGAANVALGEGSGDAQRKDAYYRRAGEIYGEVLAQEPSNIDALTGLATVASSIDAKVAFLRQRLELDPNNVRSLEFLAAALSNSGEERDIAEAAALTERTYTLLPPGERKWRAAAAAASQYERANLATRAQDMRSRASADFGLAQVSAELARPELLAADRFRAELTSVCTLPVMYLVGAQVCLAGLKTASEETRRSQQPFVVTQLVEGVSVAIGNAAEYDGLLREVDPSWRSSFEETLEDFLVRGIGTLETFSAYAAITPSRVKRLETMRVAVENFPTNGELLMGLALANLDLGNHEEALRNFYRAKDILPASRGPQIDAFIRKATTPSNER